MKQGRTDERGFALLVVFLLAAAMAFTLYEEIPRVAFESARDKEQILMDRGNQYKRAIELYYTVNKRYPAELKDLENTNDKRYLRRRYKDPMTGQDEWRLIHTNGAALTDSLVVKPPAANASNGQPGNGVVPGGGPLGANNLNSAPGAADPSASDPAAAVVIDPNTGLPVAPPTQNAAALRRPSDRGFNPGQLPVAGPGGNPFPGAGNPFANNGVNPNAYDPNDPRTWPPISLAQPSTPGAPQTNVPGQPPGVQVIPGQLNPQPNQNQFPGFGTNPSNIPGQTPGLGGANPQPTFDPNNPSGVPLAGAPAVNNQPNQISATPVNTFNQLLSQPPVAPTPVNGNIPVQASPLPFPSASTPFPGQAPTNPNPPIQVGGGALPQTGPAATNPATQFINNQLFSPTPVANGPAANSGSAGPGIAGVASKFKGLSIKSYKKRTKYQEWEFVFEPAAQTGANPTGTAANGANPNGANPNGTATPGANQGQSANPLGLMPFNSGGAPAPAPVGGTPPSPGLTQ